MGNPHTLVAIFERCQDPGGDGDAGDARWRAARSQSSASWWRA